MVHRLVPALLACLAVTSCALAPERPPPGALPETPRPHPVPTTGVLEFTAPALPAGRSATEWTTFMGDGARTGIGPPTPTATRPHRTWTAPVDGDVYAEPLVAGSSVIAATERDTVYALDAGSGAVRWRTHLGEPVPLSALECGNIDPNGVTSTPVVDTAGGTIYVVAMLSAPMRHEMFALRLADGTVAWHRSVDPPHADPRYHQQRGSLNLGHGHVYLSYGGFTGDCGPYHGWVVAAPTDPSAPLEMWQVPTDREGAIWAPAGPVLGDGGDVWVTTGNTETFQTELGYDWANAVVHLDPSLSRAGDYWSSRNWANLNNGDVDLGSMSPALLPGGLVFAAGKEGVGYLLREGHLGGVGGEAFRDTVCAVGGPTAGAYGGVGVAGGAVFVPCKDSLTALHVDAAAPSFTVVWRAAPGANSPVVAYGLVWTVAANPDSYRGLPWQGTLVGLDPATGAVRFSVPLGGVPHYPSPAAAAGSMYVAGLGSVYAVSVT